MSLAGHEVMKNSSGNVVSQTPAHTHHRAVNLPRRSRKFAGFMLKLGGSCGFTWIWCQNQVGISSFDWVFFVFWVVSRTYKSENKCLGFRRPYKETPEVEFVLSLQYAPHIDFKGSSCEQLLLDFTWPNNSLRKAWTFLHWQNHVTF